MGKMSIWEDKNTLAGKFWSNTVVEDCPIYDMHGHMGSLNTIYFKRNSASEMVAHMRRAGVKRLVFSHHHALFDANFRNAEVHKICLGYPEELRMYVAVNPHYPSHIKEDLRLFDSWRPYAVGLKILADYHRVKVSDRKYEYALSFANERRLPVLFHTWGGSSQSGYEELRKVAERYPDLIIFAGHSIYGDWDNAVKLVKESPGKVYLELTAIPGVNGVIEQLVENAGSESLLLGSDLPWFDEFQVIGGVLSSKISDEDKRNIFYRNVEKLFGKNW